MNKYVLAKSNKHGNVTYWTGKYTKHGKPSTSPRRDDARLFDTAAKTYYDGAINKGLAYFRAVRLYSNNKDGFISHWWLPDVEEGDE